MRLCCWLCMCCWFSPRPAGPPTCCRCPRPHSPRCRHAPSLEALELHLLGVGPMGAVDDTSSEAEAEGEEGCARKAAADAGAGLKRQASEGAGGLASPPGRGLMLHMNYEKAAESINLELLSGRSK